MSELPCRCVCCAHHSTMRRTYGVVRLVADTLLGRPFIASSHSARCGRASPCGAPSIAFASAKKQCSCRWLRGCELADETRMPQWMSEQACCAPASSSRAALTFSSVRRPTRCRPHASSSCFVTYGSGARRASLRALAACAWAAACIYHLPAGVKQNIAIRNCPATATAFTAEWESP